jgi:enamine deaminase RidA (YjgF/YER057c/UK114 family)
MAPEFLMIDGAPTPVAPFSHAVRVGPWLLVTGQMPTDPADDAAPLPNGVVAQALTTLGKCLLAPGSAGSMSCRLASISPSSNATMAP